MLKHIFYLFLIIQTTYLNAQQQIIGTVLNSVSSRPLRDVNIFISNSSIGTITNDNGNFSLIIPQEYHKEYINFSSIGYSSKKIQIQTINDTLMVKLSPSNIELDEVVIISNNKNPNNIVKNAFERLDNNLLNQQHVLQGFLRYKEKNTNEYKWLIESAITLFDEGNNSSKVKVKVNSTRKSIDYRNVDSLGLYLLYRYVQTGGKKESIRKIRKGKSKNELSSLYKNAILWNNKKTNSIEVVLKGQMNLLRNINQVNSILGSNTFESHKFILDTTFIDSERVLYKIKISPANTPVDLNTSHTYNNGFSPVGWVYVYADNYAIKKIDYALVARTKKQITRSKAMFNSKIIHSISILYEEYQEKMYLKYISYKTPKINNFGLIPTTEGNYKKDSYLSNEERFYFSEMEILFSELIHDNEKIEQIISNNSWEDNLFIESPYDKSFWKNYNILLESNEENKMIQDLEKKISLKKQFEKQ